ncbi:MAG: RDD family protein [Nanoarchaeota archaeon]
MKTVRMLNREYSASLWKRALAYLIDSIILNFVVVLQFDGSFSQLKLLKPEINTGIIMASLIIIVLQLLYFTILEYKLQQTIGKAILNLYVKSTLNGELKFTQVLLRNITKPFGIILLIDVIYMIYKKGNQRLFEVLSNTQVVEKGVVIK